MSESRRRNERPEANRRVRTLTVAEVKQIRGGVALGTHDPFMLEMKAAKKKAVV